MAKVLATARLTLKALIVFALAPMARGDAANRTRVTIRGTGNNVTLEETRVPARRPVFERKSAPLDALGEATRLKAQGAGDSVVVAYLRAHETELPPIIDAASVTRLRKAGAGRPVVTFLSTVAAVDIGATGEGHAQAVVYAPETDAEAAMPGYDATSGYPFYGGYSQPLPARRRASALSLHRVPVPRHQPLPRGTSSMRGARGRLPID